MNHSKIILVAFISAFVAITTVFLGVTGTIIGSVLSSVLYNVFLEALEKPVENASISTNFEWDIAYVFPLIVILIIQLIAILAHFSSLGLLPDIFIDIYYSIQGVADFNLYRILGFSLVVMCVYPFVLRRNHVKRTDGLLILLVGIMFLIRGFSDIGLPSHILNMVYDVISFPIALIAFALLAYVIYSILSSARNSQTNPAPVKINDNGNLDDLKLKQSYRQRKHQRNLDDLELKQVQRQQRPKRNPPREHYRNSGKKINKSANDFQFESNDLLDDFKK